MSDERQFVPEPFQISVTGSGFEVHVGVDENTAAHIIGRIFDYFKEVERKKEMTTEAEEFRKQEEMADILTIVFNKIWKPLREFHWDTRIYNVGPIRPISPDPELEGKFSICFEDGDSNELLGMDGLYFNTEAEALRALNDRLKLALQGNLKDADT